VFFLQLGHFGLEPFLGPVKNRLLVLEQHLSMHACREDPVIVLIDVLNLENSLLESLVNDIIGVGVFGAFPSLCVPLQYSTLSVPERSSEESLGSL
jgi:hypothetical protein